jgi:hypothetical protein
VDARSKETNSEKLKLGKEVEVSVSQGEEKAQVNQEYDIPSPGKD